MSRRIRSSLAGSVLALCLAAAASPAGADTYDSRKAGHPLRMLAYALHPIGVVLDTLIFRPAHWAVHHEPLTTLFGHEHE